MRLSPPAAGLADTTRLYFADWIRIIIVFSLIPFHTALSYTGHGDTYVYDPRIVDFILGKVQTPGLTSVPFDQLTGFLHGFFMHTLFFISGMGASFSLAKRTTGQFLSERSYRLMLPTGVCVLTVIPVMSYIRNINLFGYQGSLFEFYPRFFNGIRGSFPEANIEWAHMWFPVYLFVFSLLAVPLFRLLLKAGPSSRLSALRRTGWLILPLALILPLELLLRPTWPGFQNLFDDWANFSNYLIFYILGFCFMLAPRLREKVIKAGPGLLAAGVAAYAAGTVLKGLFGQTAGWPGWPVYYVQRVLTSYLVTLGLVGTGYRYFNVNSPLLARLNKSSFAFYSLHFLPVVLFTFLLLSMELDICVKFFITVAAAFVTALAASELAVRIPGVRWVFGVRTRQPVREGSGQNQVRQADPSGSQDA